MRRGSPRSSWSPTRKRPSWWLGRIRAWRLPALTPWLWWSRALVLAAAGGMVCVLAGCARGGEGEAPQSEATLDIWAQFAGPVDDTAYYFFAIDTDGDWGADFPVPVASGPFWGNGWGTGSMTYYVMYHFGRYEVFKTALLPVVREPGGGVVDASGTPVGGDAGRYQITVGAIIPGAVAVSGEGMIQSVTNIGDQNAGRLTLETDARGTVVAGSVVFTPGQDGGRPLTAAEQAHIQALNAGGVPLREDSLQPLGLMLSLGSPAAGSQTLTVEPATASVAVRFVPIARGIARNYSATLRANSRTPTATPPIAGAAIHTADLVTGGQAAVDVEFAQTGQALGPPFSYVPPAGRNFLRASIDMADLGANLSNISVNIITTTQLFFDPSMVDPDLHCYDGMGLYGNDAVTISAKDFLTYRNSGSLNPERADDPTLINAPVSPQQRAAVDIVDWQISIQRLR